jgi:uncharacterized protein
MKSEIILNGSDNKPILLDITYKETNGASPVAIYAHGFNGFKDWGNFDLIAQQFADAGFTFVKFNFSHNGTTPDHPQEFTDLDAFGKNNYTKELNDLAIVLDWISDAQNSFNTWLQKDAIGLIGHSMGGGISVLKAAEDKRIKALISWASIAQCKTPWGSWPEEKMQDWKKQGVAYYFNGRTKQQMPMYYQLFEDYNSNTERLNILNAASKINVPFLICHGSEDTSVPVESAYQINNANPASTLFIVPSDHVFGRKHPWTDPFLPPEMQKVVDKNILFFQDNFKKNGLN